jgi:Dyp-type peroxidase family
VSRRPVRMRFDDIQNVVLHGNTYPAASFLFFRVGDAAAARRLLGDLAQEVNTARKWKWSEKPSSTLSLALTYRGLAALHVPAATLAGFPEPFRAGMAKRSAQLGERPPADNQSDPPAVDLMLWVAGERDDVEARSAELIERVAGRLDWVYTQPAGLLRRGRQEHFGFADGLSQPQVEGLDDRWGEPRPGVRGYRRSIRPGEFVLGYPDQEDVLPAAPEPADFSHDGSYLVYRKLHQDVAGFRTLLRDHAGHHQGQQEWLAARLIGRWRDGTPLALSPGRTHPDYVVDRVKGNAFGYADDPDGYGCPLGAHIRRANPRDGLPLVGSLVDRHRMIRRGIPYGEELPPDVDRDDGVDRGLVFICFVADIARQFEFVQRRWLNDGSALGLGARSDPLLGAHDGTDTFPIPGSPPMFVRTVPGLVTPRWGEYFFAPGIRGLRWLARLES